MDNHSATLANITVQYILQPIADILEQTELFCRFINDIVWGLNAYPRDLLPAHGLLFFSTIVSHFTKS